MRAKLSAIHPRLTATEYSSRRAVRCPRGYIPGSTRSGQDLALPGRFPSVTGPKALKLLILAATLLSILVYNSQPTRVAAAGDDYDSLRTRWKEVLDGGTSYDPSDATIAAKVTMVANVGNGYWASMNKSTNRAFLWSDLANPGTSGHISGTYGRLRAMALAYSTRGSRLQGNASLLVDITGGLDWAYTHWYNETKSKEDNWYDWEIGAPLPLNDTVVMLYEQLTQAQISDYMRAVNHFTPAVTMTGANRVWKAKVVGISGIISKDANKIAAARDGLSGVFAYATTGDGFYTDGSFIQHTRHSYNGGYGTSLLADLADMMYLLYGSTWQTVDTNQANIHSWVYKSFAPFLYKGVMMDMVRGREIARPATSDQIAGQYAMRAIIRLSQFAPPVHSLAYKRMLKYWLQGSVFQDFLENSSINSVLLATNIMNDPTIMPADELVGNKVFPQMDRVVHRRPGFGFSISMSSSRIYNYELINGENLKGWYLGDGATYLYNNDEAYYRDDYWATVDKYRLPGTTVGTQPRSAASGANYLSTMNWVGGVTLGEFGVAGMQLRAFGSTLTAKKSWFMFDNEIVALGSGITSSDGFSVETIVDNRKLNRDGSNSLVVDGLSKSSGLGWAETMSSVRWVALKGNVLGSDTGYYFPRTASLKGIREARTDTWHSINSMYGTSNPVTRNYATLWLDHGVNPNSAGYQYVILPNQGSAQVNSYASNPDITVLEESVDAHGVRENTLNITAVNFWSDGTRTVDLITSNRKASVLVRQDAGTLSVAISDPTQANTGTISLEINAAVSGVVHTDPGVDVIQLSPTIKMLVNVHGAKGQSFTAKFTVTGVTPVTPTSQPTPVSVQNDCSIEFADVLPGSTFYAFVHTSACLNIISGYPCGGASEPCDIGNNPYFRPNASVTRGQLAKMISISAGFNEAPGDQLFEDVRPDSSFYLYVQRMAQRGYISGYACGSPDAPCGPQNLPYFRPGKEASREQIAKMVSNAYGLTGPEGNQMFADVRPDSPFYAWVQRLGGQHILAGYECGGPDEPCDSDSRPYFRPASKATRGQLAKILTNLVMHK